MNLQLIFYRATTLFIFGIFSITTTVLRAQSQESLDQIFQSWNSPNHPGGAIAVVDNGAIVYANGFGKASIEYDVDITAETIFNIASVSKQFTAFSMILLAQEGKISLDDEVQKYVGEVPYFDKPITIRHLVHHISGLRNFQNLLAMAGWREGDSMTNDDLLEFLKYQNDLNFPVGSEYLYCNTGYVLMATIVERVTGQSFIDWTKTHIFEPLGMNHSEFRNDMTQIRKNTATSYDGNAESGFTKPKEFFDYMGNGNLYTNVLDLAKWMINFKTHELGGQDAWQILQTKGILTQGDTINYAFGIAHGNYRGLRILQHGGSIGGYRSNLLYFPEAEVGIVILSNFSSANPGGKAIEIADAYLKEHFTAEKSPGRQNPVFPREPVEVSEAIKKSFTGLFYVDDIVVDIYLENGNIVAKGPDYPPIPLTVTSDSTCFVPPLNIDVVFHNSSLDKVNQITIYNPNPQRGSRLDPQLLSLQNLTSLVGNYYSPELKTNYQLAIQGGDLVVKHTRHQDFKLIPIEKDNMVGEAFIFSQVRIVRNGDGSVKGLKVSNGRVRDLWFEKLGF